jgi:hypothetical protein
MPKQKQKICFPATRNRRHCGSTCLRRSASASTATMRTAVSRKCCRGPKLEFLKASNFASLLLVCEILARRAESSTVS